MRGCIVADCAQSIPGALPSSDIGQTPVVPAGQYHFEPGVEIQHDTSPHEVEVGGRKYKAQTASAVLCYSRVLFFQINPTFQRFDCKLFLTDAVRYMGGATERVMIGNTHGAGGTPVFVYRKHLSGWPHVRQVGGLESAATAGDAQRPHHFERTAPARTQR